MVGLRPLVVATPLARPRTSPDRAQPLTVAASSAHVADLATYRLPHHSAAGALGGAAAAWFHAAVAEVVRHLDSAPFLQLVRFPDGGGALSPSPPELSSFSVPDSVVGAPELWGSIAEAVTAHTADIVILVQRVDPHGGGAAPVDTRARAEEACRKLVASGMGESVVQGKVGECCDREKPPAGAILPFGAAGRAPPARTAVKVKALPSEGPSGAAAAAPLSGYWGVVVQAAAGQATGAEGCYLLKAVREVSAPGGGAPGCSCTHYSLTRVCQGEHMEHQFVNSWLV